jgi:hypothetical protein
MAKFLTAAEAAQRLDVRPATLYAYVSRGVLSRDKAVSVHPPGTTGSGAPDGRRCRSGA